MDEFRVWCHNKNEWEKDLCFLDEKGRLAQQKFNTLVPMRASTHTVEMFIGVYDVSRIPIYQGDLIKMENITNVYDGIYEIVWKPRKCGFGLKPIKGNYRSQEYGIQHGKHMKVIGNIHENKDLISK